MIALVLGFRKYANKFTYFVSDIVIEPDSRHDFCGSSISMKKLQLLRNEEISPTVAWQEVDGELRRLATDSESHIIIINGQPIEKPLEPLPQNIAVYVGIICIGTYDTE